MCAITPKPTIQPTSQPTPQPTPAPTVLGPACPIGESLQSFCAPDSCKAFTCIDSTKVKICVKTDFDKKDIECPSCGADLKIELAEDDKGYDTTFIDCPECGEEEIEVEIVISYKFKIYKA